MSDQRKNVFINHTDEVATVVRELRGLFENSGLTSGLTYKLQ